MEIVSKTLDKKLHGKRSKYQRLNGSNRKIIKIGEGNKRSWRIRVIKRLRLKIVSPTKLWIKLKNGYLNMMLNLAGNVGYLNNASAFRGKRIPKARQVPTSYTNDEFHNRLVFEIYKNIMASRELATQ